MLTDLLSTCFLSYLTQLSEILWKILHFVTPPLNIVIVALLLQIKVHFLRSCLCYVKLSPHSILNVMLLLHCTLSRDKVLIESTLALKVIMWKNQICRSLVSNLTLVSILNSLILKITHIRRQFTFRNFLLVKNDIFMRLFCRYLSSSLFVWKNYHLLLHKNASLEV